MGHVWNQCDPVLSLVNLLSFWPQIPSSNMLVASSMDATITAWDGMALRSDCIHTVTWPDGSPYHHKSSGSWHAHVDRAEDIICNLVGLRVARFAWSSIPLASVFPFYFIFSDLHGLLERVQVPVFGRLRPRRICLESLHSVWYFIGGFFFFSIFYIVFASTIVAIRRVFDDDISLACHQSRILHTHFPHRLRCAAEGPQVLAGERPSGAKHAAGDHARHGRHLQGPPPCGFRAQGVCPL